jgi:four helix bundle protein
MKKTYDLEERTALFAKCVRKFIKLLPRSVSNAEDSKQLVRSSGSVGVNYIEANDSLSKKDFIMRIKICRKEAKESRYWFKLLDVGEDHIVIQESDKLYQESTELMNIFGVILRKSENK